MSYNKETKMYEGYIYLISNSIRSDQVYIGQTIRDIERKKPFDWKTQKRTQSWNFEIKKPREYSYSVSSNRRNAIILIKNWKKNNYFCGKILLSKTFPNKKIYNVI